mgnify:CR=1 FL=1
MPVLTLKTVLPPWQIAELPVMVAIGNSRIVTVILFDVALHPFASVIVKEYVPEVAAAKVEPVAPKMPVPFRFH